MTDSAIPFGDVDHALTDGGLRGLWLRCALGDQLAFGDGSQSPRWYRQAAILETFSGPRTHVVCLYESADDGAHLVVDLGGHAQLSPDGLLALRAQISPLAAEGKWAAFVGRVGAFPRASGESPLWACETLDGHYGVVGARRLAHPSPHMDRLMMRDRMAAGQDLIERLLGIGVRRSVAASTTTR